VNPPQSYEVIVLGGGKGGKTLAIELGNKGVKTALIEQSAEKQTKQLNCYREP
jgi:pyruvate/2-oxoglutarate dehydrogenase complex dihydrolipoamide dehydrogenase (E3) component